MGEVLWDLFPDGERFGGAPANFACHAAIQGADVTIVSAVGNDDHGREAIRILDDYGVDTSLIQISLNESTGTVSIALDSNGKPTFTIHEDSAWDLLSLNARLTAMMQDADAVYFGTLGQRCERSRRTIRQCVELAEEANVPRILDINLRSPFFDKELIRESIGCASILKLSDDELAPVAEAYDVPPAEDEHMLRTLLDIGTLDTVVMTRGSQGAILVSQEETVDQPGVPAEVRDTVGAGDAFTAALLIALLRREPSQDAMRRACATAAAACSHAGAVP